MFDSPLSAALAQVEDEAGGGRLRAHAGLINAISLYLLPLNFSFGRGALKENHKSSWC